MSQVTLTKPHIFVIIAYSLIEKDMKMPNWVFNNLSVSGNPAQVNDLVNMLNRPFVSQVESHGDLEFNVKEIKYSNPVFAFHNIYNHRQAGISDEDYMKQPAMSKLDTSDPNWWSDTQAISKIDKSWYHWNVNNWGTKWEVAVADGNEYPDTEQYDTVEHDGIATAEYRFNTAWSPPVPVIVLLSKQYPELEVELEYEEEQGWGGVLKLVNGEITEQSEYESKCLECNEIDCLEYCEDCEDNVCNNCNFGYGPDCYPHTPQEEYAETQKRKLEV